MNHNHPKIVIVGGGSVNWTPELVKDMLLKPALAQAEIVLLDINAEAAALTVAFLSRVATEVGAGARIVATDQARHALEGAHYVIITISTGGLAAMAHDLAIPEEYGIYHTVGDTCGPGGWSRLIRNFDVFVGLGQAINRDAPGAVVLNYTNPMSTLTDVLSRVCKGPVVGLCHGLFGTLEFIQKYYQLPGPEQIKARYAGINHFFWMTHAEVGEIDAVADLRSKVEHQSLSELNAAGHHDVMGHSGLDMEVGTELFRLTGALPFTADRHTAEFLPHCLTSLEAIAHYHLVRTPIALRQQRVDDGRKRLREMLDGPLPEQYRTRSRETAADIIEAHLRGTPFSDVGNLPNRGQVSNLPEGVVVETAARVEKHGFVAEPFGPLPPAALGLVAPVAASYLMLVDACFAKDRAAALRALRLDPLCARLSTPQVEELGGRLLQAHQRFITAF